MADASCLSGRIIMIIITTMMMMICVALSWLRLCETSTAVHYSSSPAERRKKTARVVASLQVLRNGWRTCMLCGCMVVVRPVSCVQCLCGVVWRARLVSVSRLAVTSRPVMGTPASNRASAAGGHPEIKPNLSTRLACNHSTMQAATWREHLEGWFL